MKVQEWRLGSHFLKRSKVSAVSSWPLQIHQVQMNRPTQEAESDVVWIWRMGARTMITAEQWTHHKTWTYVVSDRGFCIKCRGSKLAEGRIFEWSYIYLYDWYLPINVLYATKDYSLLSKCYLCKLGLRFAVCIKVNISKAVVEKASHFLLIEDYILYICYIKHACGSLRQVKYWEQYCRMCALSVLKCIFSSQQVALCFTDNGPLLESSPGVLVCHPGTVTQHWARSPSRQEETGTDLGRWQQHPTAPSARSPGPPLQQGPWKARGPGVPRCQRWSRAALPQAPTPPGQAWGWWDRPGEFEPSETGDGPRQRQSSNESIPDPGKRPSGDT